MEGIGKDENGNFFVYITPEGLNNDKKLIPYCCPVCGGKTIVSAGFYNWPGNCGGVTSTCAETCRACGGKGYILS